MTAGLILETLERAGGLCPDPAPRVYARLFALHPEFEPLFVMDHDGSVRGSMLQTCIECLIGLAEGSAVARFLIAAARMDHAAYGVADDRFDLMFAAIRDTVRDLLGGEWTPAADLAWARLLASIAAIE